MSYDSTHNKCIRPAVTIVGDLALWSAHSVITIPLKLVRIRTHLVITLPVELMRTHIHRVTTVPGEWIRRRIHQVTTPNGQIHLARVLIAFPRVVQANQQRHHLCETHLRAEIRRCAYRPKLDPTF